MLSKALIALFVLLESSWAMHHNAAMSMMDGFQTQKSGNSFGAARGPQMMMMSHGMPRHDASQESGHSDKRQDSFLSQKIARNAIERGRKREKFGKIN